MTKETASRRILLILVVTLIAATGLVFGVFAANPVFADEEDVYSVTVMPGNGTGTAFTVQSTEVLKQSDVVTGNYDHAKGCFYKYDGEDAVWYRPPDNPFTAPEGKEFDCWAFVANGSVERDIACLPMPDYANTIITALWKKSVEPITFHLMNDGNIKYGEEATTFDIWMNNDASFAQEAEPVIIQLYNSSFTCMSHDGTIPFTLTAQGNGETDENGCRLTMRQHAYSGNYKINITNESWANAKPGTYVAIVEADVSVGGESCGSREIAVMLVVPDTSEYSLWVGDIPVVSENAANITFSDPVQASYDAASNTLTLNNYTYEGYGCDNDDVKAAIKARMDDDFTINLIGDNTVKHVYKETSAGAGIYADNNMTITGDGTLTVSDGDNADNFNSRGIRVSNADLTIESGATVNASSGKGQNSIGVNVNNLTVQGELNTAGGNANKSYGAYASDNVTVSEDGALNADGGTATNGSYGVFINKTSPSMTIKGAMTAKGNTVAIARAEPPNNAAAIQYTVPAGYIVMQSENYDGSVATSVAAGGKTSENAKYVRIIGSAPVTGVSLNKTSIALAVGDSETLTAALKPEYALHKDLVWKSSDPNVATVSENGEVTAVAAGNATITVTATNGTEDTSDDKTANCDVKVKQMINVTVPAGKTFTYNGKTRTGVAAGENYTLTGTTKAAKAGTYTAKATLNASTDCIYTWSDGTTAPKTIKWTINKAANPLKIKAKTATVKFSAVKKKSQTLGVTKVIRFTNKGQGTKSYAKVSGNKKITIAKKTGKVTVRKGLKKGAYKVKVKVKAAGNANYKASAWKVVTFKIKVK